MKKPLLSFLLAGLLLPALSAQKVEDFEDLEAPVVEAASSSPLCSNENQELSETGGAASQWSWAGPGGFVSSEQNPVVQQVDVQTGTYSLLVTDANGCPGFANLEVRIPKT